MAIERLQNWLEEKWNQGEIRFDRYSNETPEGMLGSALLGLPTYLRWVADQLEKKHGGGIAEAPAEELGIYPGLGLFSAAIAEKAKLPEFLMYSIAVSCEEFIDLFKRIVRPLDINLENLLRKDIEDIKSNSKLNSEQLEKITLIKEECFTEFKSSGTDAKAKTLEFFEKAIDAICDRMTEESKATQSQGKMEIGCITR
jgi:hypothetical protein